MKKRIVKRIWFAELLFGFVLGTWKLDVLSWYRAHRKTISNVVSVIAYRFVIYHRAQDGIIGKTYHTKIFEMFKHWYFGLVESFTTIPRLCIIPANIEPTLLVIMWHLDPKFIHVIFRDFCNKGFVHPLLNENCNKISNILSEKCQPLK